MSESDSSLAEKTRQAFIALTADQRGFIFRRVTAKEHKHHYFATLFDSLHITGFSRPQLAQTWVGKFPQQRIESFLITYEGEKRFGNLLRQFFVVSYRDMNDRFLELSGRDEEEISATVAEMCLDQVKQEMGGDPYLPLYEAAMRWRVMPSLDQSTKAEGGEMEDLARQVEVLSPLAELDEGVAVQTTSVGLEESRGADSKGEDKNGVPKRVLASGSCSVDRADMTPSQPASKLDVAATAQGTEARSLVALRLDVEVLTKQAVEIRVVELDSVAAQLQSALDRLSELEGQLTELPNRIQKKLALLKKVPWLSEFTPSEPVCVQQQAVVGAELKRMQQLDGELAQLLQIVERMMELERRVEEPLPDWATPARGGVQEFIEACERRISDITGRIEAAAALEKTLVDFVDAFGTTDEDTGSHLLTNVSPAEFCDIALEMLKRPSKPDASETVRRLRGRADLAGLILAHLSRKDVTQAINLAQGAARLEDVITARVQAGKLFAFLNYSQMREMAERIPKWASMVAELLFAGALGRNRPELLEYLDPVLDVQEIHPVCSVFYRTVVAASHRGQLGTPRAWIEQDSMARAIGDAGRLAERQRQELLDFIGRTPGMVKNYHRLRVFARSKFLRPLEQAIASGDVAAAVRLWEANGGLDKMVDECAGAVKGPYSLDQSHFHQTRRYLSTFEEKLLGWQKLTTGVQLPAGAAQPIRDAVAGLRRETSRGPQSNRCCRSLLELLEKLAGGADDDSIPASDFGERCDEGGRVHVDPEARAPLVTPFMRRSWPAAVAQESVALEDLLHDWLRSGLQDAAPAADVLVRSYVRRGHIEAARRMGEAREEWARAFTVEIESLTLAFRQKHVELLTEAGEARQADRDISECLVEIEKALANASKEADEWVGYLVGLVDAYRKRRDPVLCSLREFLVEAGQVPNENLPLGDLRELVLATRLEHTSRRIHIEAITKAAQQTGWPSSLRARWEEAAAQLDRPRLWPLAGTAGELGEAVCIFSRYLSRKLKWRDSDPSTTDAIVERLGEWVPARLSQGLEKGGADGAESLRQVLHLAKDVDEDCPSAHVLQLVGVARAPATPALEAAVEQVVADRPLPAQVPSFSNEQVISELRAEMRRELAAATPAGKPDVPALRDALRRRDWSQAQALAADWLAVRADFAASSPMSDTEAVCLLSIAGGALAAAPDAQQERLWTFGCLALGAADLTYYLPDESQEDLAARLFARLVGQPEARDAAGQALKVALEEMDDLPSTEIRSRPVAQMFRDSGQLACSGSGVAATRFARLLWNVLRMDNNYKPRASLLHLLFKLGQLKVIESLTDTAKPHQQLVVNCVRAFAHAESNPDARLHGLQLRRALEDRGGLRPWQLFMKQLDTEQVAHEEDAVKCQLESEFVTQEPGGRRTIELCLTPSLANPPQLLEVKLGGENSKFGKVVLQNEPLYGRRTVTLVIPPDFQPPEGGMARVPFEITGQTIFEKPVQIRGAWEIKFDDKPAVPIPPDEIVRAWPGASGNPVTRAKGFHGRDRELEAICTYVEAPARPRSVMVFGQRRIGKTSLLREAVASFDPHRDGVAAAFFDVSGLNLAGDGSGMATAFFQYVVGGLRGSDNAHLRTWLGSGGQERLEQRLNVLDPEASLLDCFDSLAQQLGEFSRGRIKRFALLIDEFDRFVEPLLSGHRERVQQFLWNLRSVVQRAERVSLIMAGSGLQKLLIQGYEDALFGSIDEVHVEPFSWDKDGDAVLETVFPAIFRSRLCRANEADKLAEKACELCGGHPMFLALLGSAAALLAGGRRLSPDFLNRVVERLVREGVNEPCLQISRKLFYAPTFQTLSKLPQQTQALARLILVHIAELTTPEFPWEPVATITAGEVLPGSVSRSEAIEALKRLEEERVITWDRSRSRVRITVPLTAAALRQEVFLLRDEALQLFECASNPNRT